MLSQNLRGLPSLSFTIMTPKAFGPRLIASLVELGSSHPLALPQLAFALHRLNQSTELIPLSSSHLGFRA